MDTQASKRETDQEEEEPHSGLVYPAERVISSHEDPSLLPTGSHPEATRPFNWRTEKKHPAITAHLFYYNSIEEQNQQETFLSLKKESLLQWLCKV